MANSDYPSGFTVAGHKGGGVARAAAFQIDQSYATALFCGDAVTIASGYINKAAQDSGAILGIFDGCTYVDGSNNLMFSRYWPGVSLADVAKIVTAFVYVDPDILYEVQTDTGTASTIASLGVSYDIELDHAGSTLTGQSGMELDISDTGTGQFTIYGLVDRPNNVYGVNSKVMVFNNVPVMG